MTDEEENNYHGAVPDWKIDRNEVHQIVRELRFKNFKEALGFVNQIGEIAESEGHHPDLYIYDYKKLRVELTTHAIGGLSINDFIVAAKIDGLFSRKMFDGEAKSGDNHS